MSHPAECDQCGRREGETTLVVLAEPLRFGEPPAWWWLDEQEPPAVWRNHWGFEASCLPPQKPRARLPVVLYKEQGYYWDGRYWEGALRCQLCLRRGQEREFTRRVLPEPEPAGQLALEGLG